MSKREEAAALFGSHGHKAVVLKYGKGAPARSTLRYVPVLYNYYIELFLGGGSNRSEWLEPFEMRDAHAG